MSDNNELIKIDKKNLKDINDLDNILDKFGSWVNDIDLLKQQFLNASPFEHVVIDNFLIQ